MLFLIFYFILNSFFLVSAPLKMPKQKFHNLCASFAILLAYFVVYSFVLVFNVFFLFSGYPIEMTIATKLSWAQFFFHFAIGFALLSVSLFRSRSL